MRKNVKGKKKKNFFTGMYLYLDIRRYQEIGWFDVRQRPLVNNSREIQC
jgi:hypothetical protein